MKTGSIRWHLDWWYKGSRKYLQFDADEVREADIILALDSASIRHGTPENARFAASDGVFYARYMSIHGHWPDVEACTAKLRCCFRDVGGVVEDREPTPFRIDPTAPHVLIETFEFPVRSGQLRFLKGLFSRIDDHNGRIDSLRLTAQGGETAYAEDVEIFPQGQCESSAILAFLEAAAALSADTALKVVVQSIQFPSGRELQAFADAVPEHSVPLSELNVRRIEKKE